MDLAKLREEFQRRYGSIPRIFRAPGRVNLIGEHTDYNGGFVLPMAINLGTCVAAAARHDRRVFAYSLNLMESGEFDLDHPGPRCRGLWLDYVEGVAQALQQRGVKLSGADLVILSDVSMGGGLSSSAALEVSVATALITLSDVQIDKISLALAGQKAEHEYVGTRCGIMDQFIATLGRAGHALLIDCRSLEAKLVSLNLQDMAVIICDTKVKHSLASSEYNSRRAECERGVEILRRVLPGVSQLRDISMVDFSAHAELLPKPIRERCRHVVSEDERTLSAVRALESGNLAEMGRLMVASHQSLRDDYQVSCKELDVLTEAAMSVSACVGARMTGGGFGGCTVNLVRHDGLGEFLQTVCRRYKTATGLDASVFVVESSDGAAEIQ
jgi:galactokinase